MKKIIFIVFTLVFLSGCSISPLQARKSAIVNCTKDFMDYEANVIDASNACLNILGPKDARHTSAAAVRHLARSASD